MGDLLTSRLVLRPIDLDEAQRIIVRRPAPDDVWAADFPFEGDVIATTMYLRAATASGEQRPFGYYRITRAEDGQAIGGIGFKGQPVDRHVDVGYGLVPSARGHGYAAEALTAMLTVARAEGLTKVLADTTPDNIASQQTLLRAGFRLIRSDDQLDYFEIDLAGST